MGFVGIFDGSNEELWASLNPNYGHLYSPCGNLITSPIGTLKMNNVGILIGRSKMPIRAVEEGYAGILNEDNCGHDRNYYRNKIIFPIAGIFSAPPAGIPYGHLRASWC